MTNLSTKEKEALEEIFLSLHERRRSQRFIIRRLCERWPKLVSFARRNRRAYA